MPAVDDAKKIARHSSALVMQSDVVESAGLLNIHAKECLLVAFT